jgi:putative spermidine/putrescine transport system ATP-binding protein
MSDRIVVMNEGRVDQVGAPFEIYNDPRTRFVASFIGTLNILDGRIVDPAAGIVSIDGQNVIVGRGLADAQPGQARSFALRPEALALGAGAEGRNVLEGVIAEVAFLGSVVRVRMRLKESVIIVDTFNSTAVKPPALGAPAIVSFAREDMIVLAAD